MRRIWALVVTLVLSAGCSDHQQVRDAGTDAATETEFPYLVLDAAQLDARLGLLHAIDRIVSTEAVLPGSRLRIFGAVDTSFTSPRLWLLSTSTESGFFRAKGFENPEWQPIPVEQGRAFIKTGSIGATVRWQTGDDPGSEIITAGALMLEPATLIDVVLGMQKSESGWLPQILPEGFVELYNGPDDRHGSPGDRVIHQIWADIDLPRIGEITLNLIDGRPDETERHLLSLLTYSSSSVEGVSATEVRGKPAIKVVGDTSVIYQWMETSTVTAQLIVSNPIDPTAALEALQEIDQTTWETTLQEAPSP